MTLVALLFITVGVADIVRERFRLPAGPIVGAAAGALAALLTAWGLGIAPGWALAVIAVMLAWVAVTSLPTAGQSGYLKLGLLAAATAAAWAFPLAETRGGFLRPWYDSLPYSLAAEVDLDTFMLGVGSVLVLVETANIVVRLVFAAAPRATPPSPDAAAPARRGWFGRGSEAVSPAPRMDLPLKGGRILGPFERVFLFALVMGGQFTALAALVAAKGIIRFPEISRDTAGGSKAEYFLVGSFASWSVVLAVSALLLSA